MTSHGGNHMKKNWRASERQGPGRRYWFRSASDAARFSAERRRACWTVVRSGDDLTVWATRSKSKAVDAVVAGIDPLAIGEL